MTINGHKITEKQFAYEGCHKIYLIANDEQRDQALSLNYHILPIEDIEETFIGSCPLRFIDTWDFKSIVAQGEEAIFE